MPVVTNPALVLDSGAIDSSGDISDLAIARSIDAENRLARIGRN